MKLLICSAFEPEMKILIKDLSFSPQFEFPVWKGLIGKHDVSVTSLGIGLIESALSIATVLERESFDQILLTGTCGALPSSQLRIGQIVRARKVILGDLSSLSNDSYFPGQIQRELALDHYLQNDSECVGVDVFCPLSITQSEAGVASLTDHTLNKVVENLELFSVVSQARRKKIAVESLLGVTNDIGPKGHEEWQQHHERVSLKVQQKIMEMLCEGH